MFRRDEKRILIIGLGNPGTRFEGTRHNLGFDVVRALAKEKGLTFKKESRFMGALATGWSKEREKKLYLLLPLTYMNCSGEAVRKAVKYYKIDHRCDNSFMVVVDDLATPFNKLSLKLKGSAGGHNGLKSIEESLGSQEYLRLKMGIGPFSNLRGYSMEDYVLGKFTEEEENVLPEFVQRGAKVISAWIEGGVKAAMHRLNED